MFYFNPRSRMGSDAISSHQLWPCVKISIHAPAWGATSSRATSSAPATYYNPRSRMGSDSSRCSPGTASNDFNPRSRMGSDPASPPRSREGIYFNPRSRMGSDGVIGLKLTLHERFQSTLPHGERPPLYLRPLQAQAISIHAPAWGATTALQRSFINILFQSTLPHGERLTGVCGHDVGPWISIHAPAWGAT